MASDGTGQSAGAIPLRHPDDVRAVQSEFADISLVATVYVRYAKREKTTCTTTKTYLGLKASKRIFPKSSESFMLCMASCSSGHPSSEGRPAVQRKRSMSPYRL